MTPRSPDRKAEILDATIARLVSLGVEGLRVRDVAQDVGINNATLHHHFPTKAALITAVVERFVADRKEGGGVPAQGVKKEPIEARLATYVARRRAQMREAPDMFVVLNELLVLARRDAEVRRLMTPMQDGWQAYLVRVCREAGDDPETAAARAARCRRELLGAGLELGLTPETRGLTSGASGGATSDALARGRASRS